MPPLPTLQYNKLESERPSLPVSPKQNFTPYQPHQYKISTTVAITILLSLPDWSWKVPPGQGMHGDNPSSDTWPKGQISRINHDFMKGCS